MLDRRKVLIIFTGALLAACHAVGTVSTSTVYQPVEYYAAHDLAMLSSLDTDVAPAVVFDLGNKVARFDHVHAEVVPCAPKEEYHCIRGSITMPFAVPKHYSDEDMWEFGGHTYRVLPDDGNLQIFGFDQSTIQFYVDVPITLSNERALRRYVFIWSAELGLIGWASSVHGCSSSMGELMELPVTDPRQACRLRSLVVARGRQGLFARY